MNKISILICGLLLYLPSPALAAEGMVQIVPAVMMTSADAERLKEINVLLHERQHEMAKIMEKEGLKRLSPQLPKYHPMSDNSVQALLNQLDYTNLAEKIGAELPARPDLETGAALKNNRFLHSYNNAILRSIAKKWDVEIPALVDLSKGSIEAECFHLVKQNSEIVHHIGVKRGVLK